VERIRRHYSGEWSPLKDVLARYKDFFGRFGSFQGYVEYFLLQDMVNGDCTEVRFSTPFQDFTTSPIPQAIDDYRDYRQLAIAFIEARNHRIQSTEGWARSL
jgi:hypothetical protein